jgi:hypothetical protein
MLVVVAIVGIIVTMAIPSIYRQLHPESMQKAVNDVMEACHEARAHSILNGVVTELVIRPPDKQIEVVVGASGDTEGNRLSSPDVAGKEWRTSGGRAGGGSIFTARLSDKITIEGLGINGYDWTEDEVASVHFYPNGTCDEFSIVLLSDKNERRNITLEVVTALADVESDPNKFKAR